jgi:hypothetical protein
LERFAHSIQQCVADAADPAGQPLPQLGSKVDVITCIVAPATADLGGKSRCMRGTACTYMCACMVHSSNTVVQYCTANAIV